MEDLNLIKKLSAHQYYWSIKVLVTAKDDIKNFKSGNGKLQKFTLQDMEGSKIYAIMFNEIIEKLSNILQIGKIYIISNGQVKEINKNFYNVNENIEIILNNLTKIDEFDNEAVFTSSMKLSTISEIKANPNFPSDILLLVINVHEVRLIFRQRDKKQIVKRDLQVYGLRYLIKLDVEDATSSAVYTLFDDEAEHIMGIPVAQLYKKKIKVVNTYALDMGYLLIFLQLFDLLQDIRRI